MNKFLMYRSCRWFGSIFLILSIYNTYAIAAGSQLYFDNVSGLGNAYSGEAAIADDASTEYFNPAGLVRFKNQQIVLGDIEARFNGKFTGTDNFNLPPVFIPQSGVAIGQATIAPFPFFYYARPIDHKLTFGFGVLTPYGIGIGAPSTSVMRYSGTRAIIYVIDLSPGFSYRMNERLSGGAALDFQRMSFKVVSMFPSFINGPDSRIINEAVGWGYGWHGGLLYQYTPATRVGIAYHSQSVFHPHNQSEFVVTPGGNVGNEVVSNNFKLNSTLPPSTAFSIYHDYTSQCALLGTVDFTQWNYLNHMVLHNIASQDSMGNPTQSQGVINQYYHNTVRLAVGSNYKLTHKWMMRLGFAFESDPTNSEYRTITDPGTASTSIAIGVHYQAHKGFSLDGGYMHFFMRPSGVHVVNGYNVENGTVRLQRDAAGVQATWDFV